MPRGFPRSSDGRQIKWHFRLLFYFHFVWKKKFNDVQLTLYIPQVIVFPFHHLVNQLKLFLSTSVLNSYFLYKSKKENPATNVHFSFSKIKKKKRIIWFLPPGFVRVQRCTIVFIGMTGYTRPRIHAVWYHPWLDTQ